MVDTVDIVDLGARITTLSRQERTNILDTVTQDNSFRQLIEHLPDAVIIHHQGQIVYCNSAANVLFRTEAEGELLGEDPLSLVLPQDIDDIQALRRNALKNDPAVTGRTGVYVRRDSTQFYCRSFLLNIGIESDPVYLVIFHDITEPIEAKQALEIGEEQFRASFEEAHIGMAIVEIDGQLRHMNNSYCRILGYSAEELKSMNIRDFTADEDIEENDKLIRQLTTGELNSFHLEKRYVRGDGDIIWASVNVAIVRDSDGLPSHMVSQIEDINDKKTAMEALVEYENALTRLNTITTKPKTSSSEKISETLRLGMEYFGLESALVNQMDLEDCTVLYAEGVGASKYQGAEMKSEDTYCYLALMANEPSGFHHVKESEVSESSCYQSLAFEAYFGTPLFVNGERYGTVCFCSKSMRKSPFDDHDKSMLRVLAQWIGAEIHQQTVERALTESAEKYRTLNESAADAIFVHDRDGNIIEVNESACEILGYSREELLDLNVSDVEVGQNEFDIQNNTSRLEKAGSFTARGIHRRKDGSDFPVEVRVSAVLFGRKEYRMAIARDMGEREKSEQALRDSEQRFRRIFEDAQTGMVVTEPNGEIRYANGAYCRMLGYSADELVSKSVVELVHPDEQADTQMALDQVQPAWNVEKRLVTKNGEIVWSHITRGNILNAEGDPEYRISQVIDISERKSTERALAQRQAIQDLLRRTATASNEAETFTDALEIALAGICGLTGWPVGHAFLISDEEPVEFRSTKSWHLDDAESYAEIKQITETEVLPHRNKLLTEVIKNKSPVSRGVGKSGGIGNRGKALLQAGLNYSVESPVMVGSEVVAILEFFMTEDFEADDHLLHMIEQIGTQLGRVIERSRSRRDLLVAMQTAEQASRAKTEFLANMSHELRSPLTAILGFTEVMQNGLFGDLGSPKYQEYVDNILKSEEHLQAIIGDILDVSAIESGHVNMKEDDIDIVSVISSSARMLYQRAEVAGVQLKIEVDPELPKIRGDARRLKQVFVNLLSNAVRFTPEGGIVEVSSEIHDNGDLALAVSDTGIGMDNVGIEKALTIFGQVESDLSRNFEGTGLGLPLSEGLMKAHGGTLEITSDLGKGTSVMVTVPAERVISG